MANASPWPVLGWYAFVGVAGVTLMWAAGLSWCGMPGNLATMLFGLWLGWHERERHKADLVRGPDADILPEGRIVGCQFRFALPVEASRQEILSWVSFGLRGGSMTTSNPLAGHEIEAAGEPVLTDTGKRLRVEVSTDSAGRRRELHLAVPDERA